MKELQYSPRSGLDVHLPEGVPQSSQLDIPLPALIYCHGGGLIAGDRKSPKGVYDCLTSVASAHLCAFISISYPLLVDKDQRPLYTAKEMVDDARHLVPFLESEVCTQALGCKIDTHRLGLAGSSAGCYIARLIVQESKVDFRSAGLLWGLGGSMFLDHWVLPNDKPFQTRPNNGLRPIMQRGEYLDMLVGQPDFAKALSSVPAHNRRSNVPKGLCCYFPELDCSKMPPTYLLHGSEDTLVLPDESVQTAQDLRKQGKCYRLELLEGSEHTLWPSQLGHDRTEQQREAALKRVAEWVVGRIVS